MWVRHRLVLMLASMVLLLAWVLHLRELQQKVLAPEAWVQFDHQPEVLVL